MADALNDDAPPGRTRLPRALTAMSVVIRSPGLATARRTQVGAHEAVHRTTVSGTHPENLAPAGRHAVVRLVAADPAPRAARPRRHGRTTRSDMDSWTKGSSDIGIQS